MSSTPVDWIEKLEAIGRGDREALARLRRLITGHLIRLGAYDQRDSWDDLAQEVMIRLWRANRDGRIREPKAFVGYSRTVTRNVFFDLLRRHRPDDDPPAEEGLEQRVASDEPGLEPGAQIDLRRALTTLPERHREVVERIYLRGFSYEEAARDLRRPRGTINRLQREAMKLLREALLPERKSAI